MGCLPRSRILESKLMPKFYSLWCLTRHCPDLPNGVHREKQLPLSKFPCIYLAKWIIHLYIYLRSNMTWKLSIFISNYLLFQFPRSRDYRFAFSCPHNSSIMQFFCIESLDTLKQWCKGIRRCCKAVHTRNVELEEVFRIVRL